MIAFKLNSMNYAAQVESALANTLTIINTTKSTDDSYTKLKQSMLCIVSAVDTMLHSYKTIRKSFESLKQDYEDKEKAIHSNEDILSNCRLKLHEKEQTIFMLQSQLTPNKRSTNSKENVQIVECKTSELVANTKNAYLESQIAILWKSMWRLNLPTEFTNVLNSQFPNGAKEGADLFNAHKYDEVLAKLLASINESYKGSIQLSKDASPLGKEMAPLRTSLEDYVNGIKIDRTHRTYREAAPKEKEKAQSSKKPNVSIQMNDPLWLFEHGLRIYDKCKSSSKVYNNFTKKTADLFDGRIYSTMDPKDCRTCKSRGKY